MAMPRTPLAHPSDENEDDADAGGAIDASLLPPG